MGNNLRIIREHFFIGITTVVAVLLVIVQATTPQAQGARLISIRDEMTKLNPNITSNHTITFTTLSGAGDPSDTITVTFDSGFYLGALTPNDILLSHGPSGTEITETLTAFPGVGTWGVSIVGSTITFTHPTSAAAGDIAGADKVKIRIGTHTGGTNQITNPSAQGSKKIEISGTFGDTGALAVPITKATIGINANFGTTPSGGGNQPPPSTNPPAVSLEGCPVFGDNATITGTHDIGTIVFVNNSSQGVNYDNIGNWDSLRLLNLGGNQFIIFAQNQSNGISSDPVSFTVVRNMLGDNNTDMRVDDFDLAGLAAHWDTDWCPSDFNNDNIIDDFDLSVIAWYWD